MRANVLQIKSKEEFRNWLLVNSSNETECWVMLKRGKPAEPGEFYYLDAVEVALCFGWIDSTQAIVDGVIMQRFTPRRKSSNWTELNKERVRRLEKLGLMTEAGRKALPSGKCMRFKLDPDVEEALKKARVYRKFKSFPPLYQRVKAGNLAFYKKRDAVAYEKMLKRLIVETKEGRMYGEWNDYGRLLNY